MPHNDTYRGPADSASVHPPQTNVTFSGVEPDPPPMTAESAGEAFRHGSWKHDRARVDRALRSAARSPMRVARFESCGSGARVYRSITDPSFVVVAPMRCGDRFCVPCARDRGRKLALNVLDHAKNDQYRMITLTLKHRGEALHEMIDRLYSSFRKLRNGKTWRRHVEGGCAFLETTYNANANEWHTHLHALVCGTYFPKRALQQAWLKVTGDSFVVDLKAVHGPQNVISYITKYAAKPTTSAVLRNHDRLSECVAAFQGRRLCLTFGCWRGIRLVITPNPEAWNDCGSLETVIREYIAGEPTATDLIARLPQRQVADALQWFHVDKPPPSPDFFVAPCSTPVGLFELHQPHWLN